MCGMFLMKQIPAPLARFRYMETAFIFVSSGALRRVLTMMTNEPKAVAQYKAKKHTLYWSTTYTNRPDRPPERPQAFCADRKSNAYFFSSARRNSLQSVFNS